MLKIEGHDILRDGTKAGYIEGDYIRGRDGKILGSFAEDHVRNAAGQKIAYIDGNYLCSMSDTVVKVSLEKVNENVEGGFLPEIGRCAVYALIGA